MCSRSITVISTQCADPGVAAFGFCPLRKRSCPPLDCARARTVRRRGSKIQPGASQIRARSKIPPRVDADYARCMAQKWRVNVTTGAPDEAKAQDIVRRLPDDSRPAYIGYGDDLALRIVAVSVEADDEGTARANAIRLVKDACRAVDWDWEPEARRITAA